MHQKNKTLSILLIILLLFTGLAITGFFIFAIIASQNNFDITLFGADDYYDIELVASRRFPAQDFDIINLQQKYGAIHILTDDQGADEPEKNQNGPEIIVDIYANSGHGTTFDIEQDSATLDLGQDGHTIGIAGAGKPQKCIFVCFNDAPSSDVLEFWVTVPKEYAGTIYIGSILGNEIEIGNLPNATIDAVIDAGAIKIGEAKDVNLSFDAAEVTAGFVKIREAENIKLSINYGIAEIDTCYGKLDINSNMSSIAIDRLRLTADSFVSLDGGSVGIADSGNVRIISKESFGKSVIQNSNTSSPVTLTINNDMGEVVVMK